MPKVGAALGAPPSILQQGLSALFFTDRALGRPGSPPDPSALCRHQSERQKQTITALSWHAPLCRDQWSLLTSPSSLVLMRQECRSGSFFPACRLKAKRSSSAGLLPVRATGSQRCAIPAPIATGGKSRSQMAPFRSTVTARSVIAASDPKRYRFKWIITRPGQSRDFTRLPSWPG
ncbi:hypothetical protein NDU88_005781 [Pleurodeles waltl]|uniref:Uncharacterized protein n=1 Tax=Pleurodeles waltl TaxID=8319 RepID=A0AAV7RL58_PLEWA|nr:hypothetical protein NDU88_005781 [Pleurodeles waltl]